MASSLAQQLQAVRQSAVTTSTAQGSRKTRASLLFERHEAGDYNRKTIYQLGCTGLQELLDSGMKELEPFKEVLFDTMIASTERHMQDKATNDKLDVSLDAFLQALSPYMLKPATHKVLEYLIRQFLIHVHNVDSLLRAALPYHDTEFFVKLVNVPLQLEDTQWVFLKNVQKNKQPLYRQQLVKVCTAQPSVLGSICSMVRDHPEFDKFVPFFAVLACQVIERAGQKKNRSLENEIVPLLAEPVLNAVRSSSHPELQRAGYLITTQMTKHACLSEKAKKLFLLSMIRKASGDTFCDALRCAAILAFQFPLPWKMIEKAMSKFSPEVVAEAFQDTFSTNPSLPVDVYFVDQVYQALASHEYENPDKFKQALNLLKTTVVRCAPPKVGDLFRILSARYTNESKNKEIRKALEAVGQTLATVKMDEIDHALEQFGEKDPNLVQYASSCFNQDSSLVGCCPLQDSSSTLRFALHHPNQTLRLKALTQLSEMGADEKSVDLLILLDRVRDENYKVQLAAMELAIKIFSKEDANIDVPEKEILATVQAVIRSGSSKKQAAIQERLMELLSHVKFSDESMLVDGLLVMIQLFPRGAENKNANPIVQAAVRLCDRNAGLEAAPVLAGLKKPKMANVLKHLGNSTEAREIFLHQLCKRALGFGVGPVCVALSNILLEVVVAKGGNVEDFQVECLETAAMLCTSPMVWGGSSSSNAEDDALDSLAKLVRKPELGLAGKDVPLSSIPLPVKVLSLILNAPQNLFARCSTLLQELLATHLESTALVSLVFAGCGAIPSVSLVGKRRALMVATAFIRAMQDDERGFAFLEVLPFLFHALMSKTMMLRQTGVECVQAIMRSVDFPTQYLAYYQHEPEFILMCNNNKNNNKKTKQPNSWIPANALLPLLELVYTNGKEFETDPTTLVRLFRGFADKDAKICVNGLIQRITALVETFHDSSLCMGRLVEDMLRPVAMGSPVSVFGVENTSELAKVSLANDLPELLRLATQNWGKDQSNLNQDNVQVVLDGISSSTTSSHDILLNLVQQPVFYENLKKKDRGLVLDSLLGLLKENGDGVSSVIGVVPFEGNLLATRLSKQSKNEGALGILEAIRARLYGEKDEDRLAELSQTLVDPLLEFVKKSSQNGLEIGPTLVCLSRCMEVIHDLGLTISRDKVDVQIALDQIQNASNAAVRNLALEFLLKCTKVFPKQALEVVLPILHETSTAEERNDFTLVILEHVTRCLTSGKEEAITKPLIEVFVSFLNTTAREQKEMQNVNRLLDLYELLVQSSLQKNKALFIVLLLLLKQGGSDENQMWLVSQLLSRFSCEDQIVHMEMMLHCLGNLTGMTDEDDDDDEENMEDDDKDRDKTMIDGGNEKRVVEYFCATHLKSSENLPTMICQLMSHHLESKEFLRQFHTMKKIHQQGSMIEKHLIGLIGVLHQHMYWFGKQIEEDLAQQQQEGQDLVQMRQFLSNILDKISALLPVSMFVPVVQEFLRDDDPYARQMAIRQLSEKVETQHEQWHPEEVLILLEMVTNLGEIVKTKGESNVNKQTALLSIDVLARTLGVQHVKPFLAILPNVVNELDMVDEDPQLASSACLCHATLIGVLKTKCLKYLPKFSKSLFRCYDQYFTCEKFQNEEEKQTRILLSQSAATCIHALVGNLGKFLSPYLDDLLTLAGRGSREEVPNLMRVTAERISQRIALEMEPRLLLGPLQRRFLAFVSGGEYAASQHLIDTILYDTIDGMSREVLITQLPALERFFMKSLDIRALGRESGQMEGLAHLERALGECFMQLVMKLSGAQMKHCFESLRSVLVGQQDEEKTRDIFAAMEEEEKQLDQDDNGNNIKKRKRDDKEESDQTIDPELRKHRGETLYLICAMLAEQLMSLSTPFLRSIMEDLLEDLTKSYADEEEEQGKEDQQEEDDSSEEEEDDEEDDEEEEETVIAPRRSKRQRKLAKEEQQEEDDDDDDEEGGGDDDDDDDDDEEQNADADDVDFTSRQYIRERSLDVVSLYCQHGRAQEGEDDGTKEFNDILDSILQNMDIDYHAHDSIEDLDKYYHGFIVTHLAPALTNLARSVNDDALWQTLLHGLLEFSKHASGAVRYEMIQVVIQLFEQQIGDSFIVLVADTLPTIAELLEDKEPEVKLAASKAAKKLQQLSGEDLTSFLN